MKKFSIKQGLALLGVVAVIGLSVPHASADWRHGNGNYGRFENRHDGWRNNHPNAGWNRYHNNYRYNNRYYNNRYNNNRGGWNYWRSSNPNNSWFRNSWYRNNNNNYHRGW